MDPEIEGEKHTLYNYLSFLSFSLFTSEVGLLNTADVDQLDATTRMTTNTTPRTMSGRVLLTGLADPLHLDAQEEEKNLMSLDNRRSTILITGQCVC